MSTTPRASTCPIANLIAAQLPPEHVALLHSVAPETQLKLKEALSIFPDADALNRFSKQAANKRQKSANRQRASRQERSVQVQLEEAEDSSAVATVMRRRRIEDASWRQLRSLVVERYFEERAKPGTLKSAAVEVAAACCEVSPRFATSWVNRFLAKGGSDGNQFWNDDNWGAHPKIRWQLQSEEARHNARSWVRQHAAPKTGKHMTEDDFMAYINETVIPQFFVPEDSYRSVCCCCCCVCASLRL